jgi:hydroxymethylpyrimidine/phosphomethylpyrimidine kinase
LNLIGVTPAKGDDVHDATGPRVALTIAGSDSGGGAGIQADLKSFAANGVFGTSAITAITAQNTIGVQGVMPVPVDFVDAQITSVLRDLHPQAVKTGMLGRLEVIELVARRAANGDLPNLVVDPVMVASSGDRLLDADAESAYVELLFPHALIVTPNLREAAVLVNRALDDVHSMTLAAEQLVQTGAKFALVKGGHLHGDAVDVLADAHSTEELTSRRIDTPNVHGTGCSTAAAIAARLARGDSVPDAVRAAKAYITEAIAGAADWHLGGGHGPIDHFGWKGNA